MAISKSYNYCLDFIKGIACICVVFMHCEFPGRLGVVIQTISRFCVPFFFMVSGYFCYYPGNDECGGLTRNQLLRKIRHIGTIVLWSSLFYLLVAFGTSYFYGYPSFVVKQQVFRFLAFNVLFIVSGHLWFLFALLYDYIIWGILYRKGKILWLYYISFFMFFAYIILAQGAYLGGLTVPKWLYRNWLVEGLAFFMLGHWIHHKKERLSIPNRFLIWTILLSTVLCLPERYLLGRDFGVNVMTYPQVIALFLYAINNSDRHPGILQIIGKRYSMWVYILHPFVYHSMDGLYKRLSLTTNMAVNYLRPVIAVLITLSLSAFCFWFLKQTKEIVTSN